MRACATAAGRHTLTYCQCCCECCCRRCFRCLCVVCCQQEAYADPSKVLFSRRLRIYKVRVRTLQHTRRK
jgi:hypothetical protein